MAISDDGMSSSESVGFFSQIGDSIKGILVGLVAFPFSFYLIFLVETCNQASEAFKKSTSVAEMKEGKPVYITGKIEADEISSQFVKSGKFLSIRQSSEVFAWEEVTRTEGTGSNKKEIKECKLSWTSSSRNPNTFSLPGCKSKPFYQKKIEDLTTLAQVGQLTSIEGKKYSVELQNTSFASNIPSRNPLDSEIVLNNFVKSGEYLVGNPKCVSAELEGCERVKLSITPIPTENLTFFGKLTNDSLGKFTYKDDSFLNAGLGDKEQALGTIKSDDSTMKWIGRVCAFLLMWLALSMMVGPITALLDFIPFVGSLGSSVIGFMLGIVAFVLTAVTIIMVNLWYVLLLGMAAILGYGYYKKKMQKQTA